MNNHLPDSVKKRFQVGLDALPEREHRGHKELESRQRIGQGTEKGISHTMLRRLRKGKALGISFDTLEKICRGLNCEPGDVLNLAREEKTGRKRGA